MGRKVVAFVAGFLIVLTSLVAMVFAGVVSLPPGSPVVIALAGGVVFFFLPDLDARTAAAKRRTEFRRALGAYLDLVALEMAGSAAPAEALPKAAQVGSGWPLALMRDTLFRATGLAGTSGRRWPSWVSGSGWPSCGIWVSWCDWCPMTVPGSGRP